MNKKGAVSSDTLIYFAIGVVVFGLLVWILWTYTDLIQGGGDIVPLSDLEKTVQRCSIAVRSNFVTNYCTTFDEYTAPSGKKMLISCTYDEIQVGILESAGNKLECTGTNKMYERKHCTSLKQGSVFKATQINKIQCDPLIDVGGVNCTSLAGSPSWNDSCPIENDVTYLVTDRADFETNFVQGNNFCCEKE